MKFNKKIACLISALFISFMPIVNNINMSYASSNGNENTDNKTDLDKTKERLNNLLNEEDKEKEKKDEEKKQKERDYRVAVEFYPQFPELTANTQNTITLNVKNTGGEHLEKGKLKLTALPAEVSLISGSSPEKNIGNLKIDEQQTINYEVTIGKDAKEGNYPITFEFTGNYGTDVNNFKAHTYTKTFYLKILKSEKSKDNTQYKPFLIQNISHPAIVNKGDVADLKFKIKNPNDKTMSSIKITVVPDEGMVNQSQNTFVENNFPAGGEKEFTVKLFPQDKAEKKNYSIKITVEPTNPATPQTDTKEGENTEKEENKILPGATQYTGIFYNAPPKEDEEKKDGIKNPQIIVSNYSYGGNPVQPNQQFNLNLSFVNTSSEKTLRNIKISLLSDEGTFIAVNSSNSFFVDTMSPNSSVTKTITFSVKPDAQTKTVPINIEYTYEDTKGNALTAKDTISIPVIQKTLLSIDEVQPPRNVMENEPVNLSVNFYNLGKTQISNLKISASGDFSAQSDSTYFLGNLDSGKSDSFSITAMPNQPKKISGKIQFMYETLDGQTHTVDKNFDFDLNPMPQEDMMPQDMMPQEPPKKNYTPFIIAGTLLVGVIAAFPAAWESHDAGNTH